MDQLFDRLFGSRVAARRTLFAVCLVYLVCILVANGYLYVKGRERSIEAIFAQREGVAALGGAVLEESLSRLTDTAVSLSSRVRFSKLVSEGKWVEAVRVMETVPKDFPYVERIFLSDLSGVLRADTPELYGVRGQDFSSRDWYKGVSKEWKPYISEVYTRSAPPQVNVIAVAAPIKTEDGVAVGVLVMQIRLETLLAWSRDISFGQSATAYFVDNHGQIAAHPAVNLQGSIMDASNRLAVKRALANDSGAMLAVDELTGEEAVIAYAPVKEYGWGVIVEQPSRIALAEHYRATRNTLSIQLIVSALGLLLLAFVSLALSKLALHRQREKAFLQSLGDGLVAIDQNWNILLWNPAATRITGWAHKEAMGKPFREIVRFVRERDRSENILFISEAMLSKSAKIMQEKTVLVRKDGSEVPVGDSAAPILDEAGSVVGAIIVFRDTTEERHAQMIRSSYAYASHQLRTPLTHALWNMELALQDCKDKGLREKLQIAHRSMQSVQKLIRELTEVSEIDQGLIIPKREEHHVGEIIDHVVRSLKEKAQIAGVDVLVSRHYAVDVIKTDKHLLTRMMYEVIDNAISYSPKGSEVAVSVSSIDHEVMISVADHGVGIPTQQQSIIFTKFFRGQNIPPASIGAGLGLFISSAYAKMLGGKIWFKSAEGKGSTFFITIHL